METNLQMVFGRVLREIRTAKGLSQERLALDSGLHRTYVSLLERGKKGPSLNILFRLSNSLEIAPSVVIQRVEEALGAGVPSFSSKAQDDR